MAFNKKTNTALVSSISPAVSDEDTKKEMMHHSKIKRVETLKDSCCSKKDEGRLIQIFINHCGRAPICLQQHPSTTIFTLKGILQYQLGIKPEKQQLSTLKGIVLCDGFSLEDQNIEQDANLELSIGPGLLGGTRKRKNKGKPNRNRPKSPSRETTQMKESEKRQNDTAREHVTKVTASKSPVFIGPAENNTFIYNNTIGAPECFLLLFFSVVAFIGYLIYWNRQPEHVTNATDLFLLLVLILFVSVLTFICYRNRKQEYVTNATAPKSPAGANGGNDETDTTTNPQSCRARESKAADLCEEELRERYMSKDSKVQMNPLLKKKHILDIYTDLALESQDEEGGSQEERKLESYEEVFTIKTKEGKLINRTIFEGKAGLGKSTLISKIVYDWANKSSEVLTKYKLVFALKMHALEETSDFIKAIFTQLLAKDTKVVGTDLQSYIEANQENVLILLDGFDEFMTTTLDKSKFGSVLEIVSRDRLRKCCVVVTTRPSQYHTLRTKLIPDTMNRVKVLGFRKEDVEKYVKRVYQNNMAKAKELLQKIQSSNVLSELAKSPMLLLMLCALWQDSSSLPTTLYLLYKDALNYLFERKKEEKDTTKEEISRVVNEIGKIALDGLLSEIQKLLFAENLFEKSVLDLALGAGILNSQKVKTGVDSQNSIQFLHKTMQELCAGLYLQNLLKESFDEFQKILSQIKGMRNLLNLDYLLRFCCGGNDDCTNAVLTILREKYPDDHRLTLKCYFENQSKEPPTDDFINLVVTSELSIEDYDSDSLLAFAYFLNRVISTKSNKGAVFLGKVDKVALQSCNLENFIHKLLPLMSKMRKLSVLNFQNCQGLGSSGSLWAPYLGDMQELGKLKLQYCQLNDNDVKHIAAIVTLFSLDLSHNEKLGGKAESWAPYLGKMQELGELKLQYCQLNDDDVKHIAAIVTLFSLDLSHNEKLGGKAESWAPCLEEMENLKLLILRDCSLEGEDVEVLADMDKLINLQLCGNVKLRLSTSEWSKCLHGLKHLKKLCMNDCNIATKDLKFIAQSCSDMPSLVTCSVDNNVHPAMNYMVKISDGTKLHIRGCSVSNANLADILKIMSKRTDLKELHLSEFEILDHADTAWCAQLQQFNLKRLVFNNFGLRGKTIQYLVEQLKSMPDLTELYLNGNTDLKGSAKTWFPLLQRLLPLKKLVLQDCNLTRGDWEHVKTYSNCEVDDDIVQFK